MLKGFINNNKKYILTIALACIAIFFVWARQVVADDSAYLDALKGGGNIGLGIVGGAISLLVGGIAYLLTAVIGLLITLLSKLVVQVAQFNNIVNVPAVENGWGIIRDICNMFFILILLIIAFATILRMENYSIKKMLPKLLIMAVLINFSKTIFGLIIDASQVIMLTFTNAFAQGSGWFIDAFRVNILLSIKYTSASDFAVTTWATALAIVAGLIAAIITLIIMGVMLGVLVARIVLLWIYTIFSPLVFLGFAFPPLQKYSGQIWQDFTKQVVVGPVLAFFIWLTLTTASTSSEKLQTDLVGGNTLENQEICAGIGAFFCEGEFQKFIITVGLLMGGLMVAQQMGGAAAGIAGKGLNWAKSVAGAPLAAGTFVASGAVFKAGRTLDTWQMKAQSALGLKYPKSMNYRMIKAGWEAKRKKDLENYEEEYGGLDIVWKETFQKYSRGRQYMTWRKSEKALAEDYKEAKPLMAEMDILRQREVDAETYNQLTHSEKRARVQLYNDNMGKTMDKYKEIFGNDDNRIQAEIEEDLRALNGEGGWEINGDVKGAKFQPNRARMEELESEIARITDPRVVSWSRITAQQAQPWKYEESEAGNRELRSKREKEMEARTGGRSVAIKNELLKALAEGDQINMYAALALLDKRNDLNEALKDRRFIDLMTKNNGILEKMSTQGLILKDDGSKVQVGSKELENIKKDFRANPVSPANAQALVRGLLNEVGLKGERRARYEYELGEQSFESGNGMLFAMAGGDAHTGVFRPEKLTYGNERLQTSEARKYAIAGKYNNQPSRSKTNKLHPDMLIAETPTGAAGRLHEDAETFLKYMTYQDLDQLYLSRPDVIKKIGQSERAMREMYKFSRKLADDGDKSQAQLVEYFVGYIHAQTAGTKKLKDQEKIEAGLAAFKAKHGITDGDIPSSS